MLKTFDIVLDLEKDLYSPAQQLFTLSQSDVGSAEFIFHIMQDDLKVDLTNMAIQLGIKKPSGMVFYQDCELTDATQGVAQVLLSAQAYDESGIFYAEVYVKDPEGDTSVSCPFYFGCRESLTTQAVADPTLGQVDWTNVVNKPATYPPSPHTHLVADITDFGTGVAANIPAEYLTQTEADTLYAPYGTTGGGGTTSPAAWGGITGTLADQTDLQNALDAKADVTAIPDTTGMLTQTTADARYQQIGTDTPDAWVDITGKPTVFPPDVHTHTSADITDFAAAVAADIPAEYLTQTEGDARYNLKGTTGTAASVDWGNITGTMSTQTDLQAALDAKADSATALTQTTADARYQQIGTDTPDDWVDITNKPATFPPSAHTHTSADISDFGTAVAGAIPAEYLTATEGDAAYQKLGVYDDWTEVTNKPATFPPSAHTHTSADISDFGTAVAGAIPAEYLTATEGDAAYQKLGTYDDWANITGKPTSFPPSAHTHAVADVTGLQTALDAKAPLASPTFTGTPAAPTPAAADNSTAIATTAFVQGQGFMKTIPIMTTAAVGGAQVGNGLTTSGNYLLVKTGASLGINATNYAVQVQDQNAAPITMWRGTQAAYDAIAQKDGNTLYFISG